MRKQRGATVVTFDLDGTPEQRRRSYALVHAIVAECPGLVHTGPLEWTLPLDAPRSAADALGRALDRLVLPAGQGVSFSLSHGPGAPQEALSASQQALPPHGQVRVALASHRLT